MQFQFSFAVCFVFDTFSPQGFRDFSAKRKRWDLHRAHVRQQCVFLQKERKGVSQSGSTLKTPNSMNFARKREKWRKKRMSVPLKCTFPSLLTRENSYYPAGKREYFSWRRLDRVRRYNRAQRGRKKRKKKTDEVSVVEEGKKRQKKAEKSKEIRKKALSTAWVNGKKKEVSQRWTGIRKKETKGNAAKRTRKRRNLPKGKSTLTKNFTQRNRVWKSEKKRKRRISATATWGDIRRLNQKKRKFSKKTCKETHEKAKYISAAKSKSSRCTETTPLPPSLPSPCV